MGGFGIVVGDPGIGKTKAVMKYAEDNPTSCIAITAGACIRGTRAVLKKIARELNIPLTKAIDDLYASIIAKLHDGMVIIVDEAQLLTYGSIETLRAFADHYSERGQTLGVALVGNDGIREKIEGRSREQYRQVNNRAWQRQQLRTMDVQFSDIEMLFPILEGRHEELSLLHCVAKTEEGVRCAFRLLSNAYDVGNYDFNSIVKMAKMMHLDLKGADKAVRS